MYKPCTARAPAKVILTGEYATLFGKPAIATAVGCYAYSHINKNSSTSFFLDLLDIKTTAFATMRTLKALKKQLLDSYTLCLEGKISIKNVLKNPTDLFNFTVISLLDTLKISLQKGAHLQLSSKIPIGCGMGSSAATVVACLQAMAHFLGIQEATKEWLHKLSIQIEKLQHGTSSGLDPYMSIHGGCVRFEQGEKKPLKIHQSQLYLINTGKPEVTTGQCVLSVKSSFTGSSIWSEFQNVTETIENALITNNEELLRNSFRDNQLLLEQIGVVPTKVRCLIEKLYQQGYAAKISGAGAISGEPAGIVLAIGKKPPQAICDEFGYPLYTTSLEEQGVQIV